MIRSPIDGVVIERNVDVGQTVAASLEAPVLYTIARDLRRLQVETFVDEADIGAVQPGQSVTFSVAAFPAWSSAAPSLRSGKRRRSSRTW